MAKQLQVGEQWGALHVTNVSYEEYTNDLGRGVKEKYDHTLFYDLQCACGTEIHIWHAAFPGKRMMVDCGKCGEGQKKHYDTAVKVVTLDVELIVEISRWGRNQNMKFSDAIAALASIGLEQSR